MIKALHTKWKAIATIAIVVVATLNLSGFCYSETRFLSLDELCERTFKAKESQMPMDYSSWREMWKTQKAYCYEFGDPRMGGSDYLGRLIRLVRIAATGRDFQTSIHLGGGPAVQARFDRCGRLLLPRNAL